MNDTAHGYLRQTITALVALSLFLSVLGPVGMAAADPNVSIEQTADSTTVTPGETVTLTTTLTAEDVNGPLIEMEFPDGWDGTVTDSDGGTVKPQDDDFNVLPSNSPSVVWLSPGTYEVTTELQVPEDAASGDYTISTTGSGVDPSDDDEGIVNEDDERDSTETTITVEEPDQNEDPSASFIASPSAPEAGETVSFDASGSSDEDGSVGSYEWDFGDGDTETGATPTHTYDSPGDYDVTLTVTDDDGASDTATQTLSVSEAADPADFQVSNLNAPESAAQGDNITVSADVTNDGDEEATQTVAFRLDGDGDGTIDGDLALASQEVTLDGGESQTVTFSDLDTSGLLAGDYVHGVVTENDSATATIAIDEPEASASETSVSLSPDSAEVVVGDTQTYDVVVDSADGGVGAYELTVSLDDASAASITDVTVAGNPGLTDVSYAEDNSSVTISAALADTADTGSVSVASIAVEGTADGSSNLSVDVEALGTEAGDSYAVTDENGASVSVIDIGPVGDFEQPPTDPDDDGLYEDVNGDGKFDIVDAQALFANLDDETVEDNPDKFDFNGDETLDVVDVQKLFTEVPDQ